MARLASPTWVDTSDDGPSAAKGSLSVCERLSIDQNLGEKALRLKGAGNAGMIVAIFRPIEVCSVMPSVARAGGIKRTR